MQTKRTKIIDLADYLTPLAGVRLKGWVKTARTNKHLVFLEVNDGSCAANFQVVCPSTLANFEELRKITTGTSVDILGDLVVSPAKGQRFELRASEATILALADSDYPMQKKGHSLEFLRTLPHLRVRTTTFGAVMRIRSYLAQAIHLFFREQRFMYVHTPIITGSDCEGAGEMFQVTTQDLVELAAHARPVHWEGDFFGKPTYLTVSGQLAGEAMAMGLADIYTFGPTFRAENSNTSRHAAEFWMIEPEAAFADLDDNIQLIWELLSYLIEKVLRDCADDLTFLDEHAEKGLVDKLRAFLLGYERLTYTEAIEHLKASGVEFEYKVEWGMNLQAEHERYLAEQLFKKPTFVTDYPKEIKAFYMRRNDDGKTVAAVDLLVPRIGELVGGSQREERLDVLKQAIAGIHHDDTQVRDYDWYLDTRRYGSVPHAGFGLGFERLIMFVTGMENIRDVVPFPRTPRTCEG